MNIASRIPVLGIAAGIALLIVGFNQGNTALIIIGIVLIILGIFRLVRK
jgi:uncharacterized membrane protein HdeD (DUF308 family)